MEEKQKIFQDRVESAYLKNYIPGKWSFSELLEETCGIHNDLIGNNRGTLVIDASNAIHHANKTALAAGNISAYTGTLYTLFDKNGKYTGYLHRSEVRAFSEHELHYLQRETYGAATKRKPFGDRTDILKVTHFSTTLSDFRAIMLPNGLPENRTPFDYTRVVVARDTDEILKLF